MNNILKSALLGIAIMMSVNFVSAQEITTTGYNGDDYEAYSGNVTDIPRDFVRIKLENIPSSYATGTSLVCFYNPWPGVTMSIPKPVVLANGNWSGDFIGNPTEHPVVGNVPSIVFIKVVLWNGNNPIYAYYYGSQQGLHTFYFTDFKPGDGSGIILPNLPF